MDLIKKYDRKKRTKAKAKLAEEGANPDPDPDPNPTLPYARVGEEIPRPHTLP